MNSPMKFGLVCVLCVLCAGSFQAAEVEGDVKFAVPADATRDYSQQLLSWTSIDDGSKAKLQAATIVNGSDLKTKNFKLIVSDTGCTLKYETPGMAIFVR